MTDVFISYKRRWREQVEGISQALRELEVDVWFDADLEPGSSFSSEISREIRTAKSVLACLSNDAFPHGGDENGWVLGEATIGRDRKVLVAVMLEPTILDPPWNTVHIEDLTGFSPKTLTGERSHWQNVLSAIGRHIDRPGLADFDRANATGTVQALKDWAQRYPADRLVPVALARIEALKHPDHAAAQAKETAAPTQSAAGARAGGHSRDPTPGDVQRHGAGGGAKAIRPDAAARTNRGHRLPILLSLVVVVFAAAALLTWQLGLLPSPSAVTADSPAPALAQSQIGTTAVATTDKVEEAPAAADRADAAASTGSVATNAVTPTATDRAAGRIVDLKFEIVAMTLPRPEDIRGAVEQLHKVTVN